jgi:hypothetical protein
MTLDQQIKIAARIDELKRLASETTAAARTFQRALVEVMRERRLCAERNAPGETRAHHAALRRR